jgi:hypothetical protein
MLSTAFYTAHPQVVPCKRIATKRCSGIDLESAYADSSFAGARSLLLFFDQPELR